MILLSSTLESFQNKCIEFDLSQGMLEKGRSKISIFERFRYAINDRKRYQGWNVSRDSLICTIEQQVHERL